MNVCQSNLFEDCITAFARHSFETTFSLKVRFIGEPAVDVGGPRQELFQLFLNPWVKLGAFSMFFRRAYCQSTMYWPSPRRCMKYAGRL